MNDEKPSAISTANADTTMALPKGRFLFGRKNLEKPGRFELEGSEVLSNILTKSCCTKIFGAANSTVLPWNRAG
jgi:hypothetical protein